MDEATKNIVNDFIQYLIQEMQKHKEFKHVQIGKWSIDNFDVTIRFFMDEKMGQMHFDIRELKENRDRFSHLMGNAFDQMNQKITESAHNSEFY